MKPRRLLLAFLQRVGFCLLPLLCVCVAPAAFAQQAAGADDTLPLPQANEDQPPATYDETPNPAPIPGAPAPAQRQSPADDSAGTEEYDDEESGAAPNIDAIRIASLSVWLGANAAIAAGYTGAGFFVEGPLAVIWGAFGGAFMLAPLGAAIGAGIGAILGLVLWTASADEGDRPEAESPIEVLMRQVDRLLRGAQAATLGILITAGAASIGGLTFAFGGGIVGGLLAEQPGFFRQGTYVLAGLSLLVTSAGVGVGAYFAHLQLDRFTNAE